MLGPHCCSVVTAKKYRHHRSAAFLGLVAHCCQGFVVSEPLDDSVRDLGRVFAKWAKPMLTTRDPPADKINAWESTRQCIHICSCLHCETARRARGMDVWVLSYAVLGTATCGCVHGCVDARVVAIHRGTDENIENLEMTVLLLSYSSAVC